MDPYSIFDETGEQYKIHIKFIDIEYYLSPIIVSL
jgi:hypothetical protein